MPASRPDKSKQKPKTTSQKDQPKTASNTKAKEEVMETAAPNTTAQPQTAQNTVESADPNAAFMPAQAVSGMGGFGMNQNTTGFGPNPFSGQGDEGKKQHKPVESIDAILGAATNLNGDGDILVSYQRAFEASLKADMNIGTKYKTEYNLIPMSGVNTQLPVDALILTRKVSKTVYVYTFMISASLSVEIQRQEYINGNTHQCSHTVGDLYDDEYYSEVEKTIKRVLGDVTVSEVSSTVLPADLDPDNAVAISKLKGNAINAINGVIIRNDDSKKINAKWLKSTGGLSYNMRYTKAGVTTISGQPARSDAVITLSSGAAQYSNRNLNNSRQYAKRKDELVQTSVFVDLVPQNSQAMMSAMNQGFMGGFNQQLNNGVYQPRVILSNVEQKCSANSLELTALGLASAVLMDDFYAWGQVFRPSTGDNITHKFHDVGAIGLERNFSGSADWTPAKIRTNDPSFTDQNLIELLSQFVAPEVIYSIDVEEGGPQTWLQNVFTRATRSGQDQVGNEATAEIIKAFDRITNNQFSVHYAQMMAQAQQFAPHLVGPLVRRDMERVHLGTYTDDSGRIRDLRDIDNMAILNHVQPGDLTPIINWTATFCPQYGSEVVRLEERERLIKLHLPNAEITGMARRVTFNRLAMLALASAIQAAQIPFNSDVAFQQFGGAGAAGFGGYAGFGGQPNFGGFGNFGPGMQPQAAPTGNRMI